MTFNFKKPQTILVVATLAVILIGTGALWYFKTQNVFKLAQTLESLATKSEILKSL